MFSSDILSIFQWWAIFFLTGIIFIPLTSFLFSGFLDKGYIFAKIIGIALLSYVIFILGFLRLIPFRTENIFLIMAIFLLANLFLWKKNKKSNFKIKPLLPIFILEELLFISILIFWSWIHAHQPEIHGLEKYMDYGFINSIARSEYFPPVDMWFPPFHINYYYFGHLITAALTKISFLQTNTTFNLMLSTISAFGFVAAFSIVSTLFKQVKNNLKLPIISGLISGLLLTFAGNLHALYLFFKPYQNESPQPFWELIFSPLTFPNSYWYPNATRFIYNTIHEFPIYSYVVSDLHGHVLSIPLVLLTIALCLSIFLDQKLPISKTKLVLVGFLLAVMYMTNAWDGIIYFLLSFIVIFYIYAANAKSFFSKKISNSYLFFKNNKALKSFSLNILLVLAGFFIFTLPFNLNFKPFASGIGILCAPSFLTEIGKIGPFIFEKDHCQHSPIWQLLTLYGFFYFWVASFIVFIFKNRNSKNFVFKIGDIFVFILILLSTILIVVPEFIYVKDIYPAHYRANTMFKLVYQAFIMLSLCSGYIIVRIFALNRLKNFKSIIFLSLGTLLTTLVFIYPYFAIKSYFGDLKTYSGLNGTNYLKSLYPSDYEAILWINENIKGQPIILEAQGDSYTDYGRISANTGLPTVLGWVVHEWLWRGSYDIPSPRIAEVQKMYESEDLNETKKILQKYNVSFVFIGDLERKKYLNINEEKFNLFGKIVYQKNNTKVFKID